MGLFSQIFGSPTIDGFAKLILKTMAQVDSELTGSYEAENCRIVYSRKGAAAGVINLANIYKEFLAVGRHERAQLLHRYCGTLLRPFEVPEEFADASPDLVPMVRPRSLIEFMRLEALCEGTNWDEMPAIALSEHLVVCLAYDLPTRLQFVNQGNLDTWGISLYEAVETARRNLEEKPCVGASMGEKVYVFTTNDTFDASRMLLVDRIRKLPLEGEPVAIPVCRDSLLLAGADDAEGLAIMAGLADKMREESRPICTIAHILRGDEWEPWCPAPANPSFEAFRLLEMQFRGAEYADQKPLLDRLHVKTGEDAFVASYDVIKLDDKPMSFCVWPDVMRTVLPRTDLVALTDAPGRAKFVPWDHLAAAVPDRLETLDYHPPRFLTRGFPTPEEIARIGSIAFEA